MINNKLPLKIYPKVNENLSKDPSKKVLDNMGSLLGSIDELALTFRSFYKESYPLFFDFIVKQVWLEQNFTYDGARKKRGSNGFRIDSVFSFFMNGMVGMSQKVFTTAPVFTIVPTYFRDFFPDFSDHNPFKESEYFKFPYSHVTIDFLLPIYQHHERIEMLNYAEEKRMNVREFTSWAVNQAMCYNMEMEKDIYTLDRNNTFIPFLRRMK